LIAWWVGRIRDESSVQELKIREVDTRIESEISGLRTAIEQSKVCSVTVLYMCCPGLTVGCVSKIRFSISSLSVRTLPVD
jgi:hypothetical protein